MSGAKFGSIVGWSSTKHCGVSTGWTLRASPQKLIDIHCSAIYKVSACTSGHQVETDTVTVAHQKQLLSISNVLSWLFIFFLQVWCSTTELALAATLWIFSELWRRATLQVPPSLHPSNSSLLLRTALTSVMQAGSPTSQSGLCKHQYSKTLLRMQR